MLPHRPIERGLVATKLSCINDLVPQMATAPPPLCSFVMLHAHVFQPTPDTQRGVEDLRPRSAAERVVVRVPQRLVRRRSERVAVIPDRRV